MPMEDDNYKGYDITKGTVVSINVWYVPTTLLCNAQLMLGSLHSSTAMSRHEAYFPEPYCFDVSRFLVPNDDAEAARDLRRFIFGFGRWLVHTSSGATQSQTRADSS